MTSERFGYRGYVTSRPFGGLHVPVPLQSLALRDYCARHGLAYKLHANENKFPHSYLVLEGLLTELDRHEGLLATSMFMMPERRERRRQVYRAILDHGASLHFVLEEFVIRREADIAPVEEILSVAALLPLAPKRLPAAPPDPAGAG